MMCKVPCQEQRESNGYSSGWFLNPNASLLLVELQEGQGPLRVQAEISQCQVLTEVWNQMKTKAGLEKKVFDTHDSSSDEDNGQDFQVLFVPGQDLATYGFNNTKKVRLFLISIRNICNHFIAVEANEEASSCGYFGILEAIQKN